MMKLKPSNIKHQLFLQHAAFTGTAFGKLISMGCGMGWSQASESPIGPVAEVLGWRKERTATERSKCPGVI